MVDIDAKEPDLVSKHKKEKSDYQNDNFGETVFDLKSPIS